MRQLVLAMTLAAAVLGQQERPKPSPEIEALLDSAMAAPPELAADILLTLVDYRKIPSKEQRIEVIERAFELAGLAKFPAMESAAVARAEHTDSSPGIRHSALENGLSALGLRSRAVRSMLALDKPKAIEMFRRIQLGPFRPLTCDDALAPSMNEYYETLRELVATAYTAEDRKEGRQFEFVETAVRTISIPRQLEPVARLLATLPLTADKRAEYVAAYAVAMSQLNADGRSFGSAGYGFGQATLDLANVMRKQGSSTLGLASAFRAYLVRHLEGALCAEAADPAEAGVGMRQMVEKFYNNALLADSGATDVAPLKFEDLKPHSVGGRAKFSDYWSEGRSAEIMAAYKALRFGTKEQQEGYQKRERRKDGMAHFLPEELRRTSQWETQAREFLNELDRWSTNHEDSEIDFFHQMCIQYAALLDIVPSGSLHDTVLQKYISFLKSSLLERESAPEWLIHVQRLFRVTDSTPGQLQQIRNDARKYGSLTMSLYADMARLEQERKAR